MLILKTATCKNQISFWMQKGALFLEAEQILGERIREYGPDFEAFTSYVDSAERRTTQLRSNLKSRIQNKKIVGIVPANNTENTLIQDFSNNLAILKQFITILETQQISYDEIKIIVKKENKVVTTTTWLVETSTAKEDENGGI